MKYFRVLTLLLILSNDFLVETFSPLLTKSLRRAVKAQRRREAKLNQPPPAPTPPPVPFSDKLDVYKIQQVWKTELEHLEQYEKSILSDPDLAGVTQQDNPKIVHNKSHRPHIVNVEFREMEKHRHDSVGNEIAHSIEADSYLAVQP